MTPSWYLVALAFVLGAAITFVAGDVIRTIRRTGRHAARPALEQRGELLHLDWSDQRPEDDIGSRRA